MFTLESGSGFWNPVLWALALFIAFLLLYGIRGFGRITYNKGTEQTKPFLSGNQEVSAKDMQIKASNLYWGFTKNLNSVYTILRSMHSGSTSDYILWFVLILAMLFLIVGVM